MPSGKLVRRVQGGRSVGLERSDLTAGARAPDQPRAARNPAVGWTQIRKRCCPCEEHSLAAQDCGAKRQAEVGSDSGAPSGVGGGAGTGPLVEERPPGCLKPRAPLIPNLQGTSQRTDSRSTSRQEGL